MGFNISRLPPTLYDYMHPDISTSSYGNTRLETK